MQHKFFQRDPSRFCELEMLYEQDDSENRTSFSLRALCFLTAAIVGLICVGGGQLHGSIAAVAVAGSVGIGVWFLKSGQRRVG